MANTRYIALMVTIMMAGSLAFVFDVWRDSWVQPEIVVFDEPLPLIIGQGEDGDWTYRYTLTGQILRNKAGSVQVFIENPETGSRTGPIARTELTGSSEVPREVNFTSGPRQIPQLLLDGEYHFLIVYEFPNVAGEFNGWINDTRDPVSHTFITEAFVWDRDRPVVAPESPGELHLEEI